MSCAIRRILRCLRRELVRLNRIGLGAAAGRRHESIAFRAELARRYRDRPPCC